MRDIVFPQKHEMGNSTVRFAGLNTKYEILNKLEIRNQKHKQ